MRLGKSPGDTRTKTLLGVARLCIITNMSKYVFTRGTPTVVFFFPTGAEKPGKAVSPARAGVWRRGGKTQI